MDEPIIVAGLLNSALYLIGVTVAGLCWGNHQAVVMALASLGVATWCYAAQMGGPSQRLIAQVLHLGSNLLGAAAGVMLMIGIL
jgi:hypothetical protein